MARNSNFTGYYVSPRTEIIRKKRLNTQRIFKNLNISFKKIKLNHITYEYKNKIQMQNFDNLKLAGLMKNFDFKRKIKTRITVRYAKDFIFFYYT